MEQSLSCNVQECGAQLTGQAVVTVCSHVICPQCASNHGFSGKAPYTCPICNQPLNASEVCEQLLQPSEEWKSIALSGLGPTVVMECAGRALSFWSYQMTNQISSQARRNGKLKDYCAELQGEIENIWGQANQRITTLTSKIRDMEREEHTLRRQCEDLRLTLENRTRELSQSQELYSKLKRRVLLGQTQDTPPSVLRSRTPVQPAATGDTGHGQAQSQLPRSILPVGARTGATNYFPASPGYSKPQNSASLMDWNQSVPSRSVPATPSSNLPVRNPRSLAFVSTPRAGVDAALSVPRSGRFHHTASVVHGNVTDGPRGFPEAQLDVASVSRPLGGRAPDISTGRPPVGRAGAVSVVPRDSPQSTARRTSQQFELPGPIFRRP
ncbi:hypothetical protein F5144DRAFT_235521 [Chaetomium tenue]|uniref:Uncharacterized protein n=1 Tax=Chaetomium tenue TaxID=1854479 RepID=A0ACB7P7K4_9PEZI|nr:hypothetical protein F5144DRAFT_235521 [Chaetomium globosum]